MDIREAPRAEWPAWDTFLDRTAEASPLARSGWLLALERAYGIPTTILLATRDGAVRGGCACYIVRDVHGVQTIYSLRYGFIAGDDAVAVALAEHVVAYARTHRIARVHIASGMQRVAVGVDPIVRETVVFSVAASETVQWDALRNKTRNMVRKAQRAGCVVRCGTDDDWDTFHAIYTRRMLAKGVSVHARAFLSAVRTLVPGTELLIAERGCRMIGGLLLAIGTGVAAYPYQAAVADADRYAPTPLLVWEALRRCVARGVSLLDMGESTPGGSVHAAKVHFGGIPRSIYNHQILNGTPRAGMCAAAHVRVAKFGMRYAPAWVGTRCGVWLRQRGRMV